MHCTISIGANDTSDLYQRNEKLLSENTWTVLVDLGIVDKEELLKSLLRIYYLARAHNSCIVVAYQVALD